MKFGTKLIFKIKTQLHNLFYNRKSRFRDFFFCILRQPYLASTKKLIFTEFQINPPRVYTRTNRHADRRTTDGLSKATILTLSIIVMLGKFKISVFFHDRNTCRIGIIGRAS